MILGSNHVDILSCDILYSYHLSAWRDLLVLQGEFRCLSNLTSANSFVVDPF